MEGDENHHGATTECAFKAIAKLCFNSLLFGDVNIFSTVSLKIKLFHYIFMKFTKEDCPPLPQGVELSLAHPAQVVCSRPLPRSA